MTLVVPVDDLFRVMGTIFLLLRKELVDRMDRIFPVDEIPLRWGASVEMDWGSGLLGGGVLMQVFSSGGFWWGRFSDALSLLSFVLVNARMEATEVLASS